MRGGWILTCLGVPLPASSPTAHPVTCATIAEAKGVTANRLQNIVITLDKVKRVLEAAEQPQGPCLELLSEAQVLDHLWNGAGRVGWGLRFGGPCV